MIKTLHVPIGALASAGFDPYQQLFLTMVLSFRNTETGCRMSHQAIADHMNCSKRHIIRMVQKIEKDGWIKVKNIKKKGTNQNESNEYTPTAKLLSLLGSDSRSLGSDKTLSLGSDSVSQNTLLSEEKSIEMKIRDFLVSRPSLKLVYENQQKEYGKEYADKSILKLMNQTQS